jgi:MYXO-CTERM domain-containing protein
VRHHAVVLGLVSAVLAPIAIAGAAEPTGSIGIRLLDAPTSRRADPRAHAYIVDHLSPGGTIQRQVAVYNETSTAARIEVYPAAAAIRSGAFVFADGHTPNELSTWTSVDQRVLDLPAGQNASETVTVRVPRDASPGERYAVIWAEVRTRVRRAGRVSLVARVGVRIYLSVGAGGEPHSNFEITDLTAKRLPSGKPAVLATVHNTGGRALDMSGSLELTHGPAGLAAGPFPAALGTTLAPGDVEPVTVPLDARIPDGPWLARVRLQSGLLVRSAHGTIIFPATDIATTAAKPSKPTSPLPGSLITVGILLLLLALVVLLVRRRRRDHESDS